MMAKVIPVALLLLALLGGAAAGHFLRPPPAEGEEEMEASPGEVDLPAPEVVSLRNLFIVPVLRDGRLWSHVVLSLGIESYSVSRADVLLLEPLLRDGMNEILYLHASLGGFEGDFTAPVPMKRLRARLDSVIADRLGDPDARVLVISMVRQNG